VGPGSKGAGGGAAGAVSRDALVEQVAGLVAVRLLDPLEILLGDEVGVAELRRRARVLAEEWAADLLGDDDQRAGLVAARLVAALYTADAPFDPPAGWWRTPLGQVVVRRVGHPAVEAVAYAVAGAMLGMTRQGVHDLATRGKLARHPDGGVTVASVRARLRQRDAEQAQTAPPTPAASPVDTTAQGSTP
jgi:hypothetical protein